MHSGSSTDTDTASTCSDCSSSGYLPPPLLPTPHGMTAALEGGGTVRSIIAGGIHQVLRMESRHSPSVTARLLALHSIWIRSTTQGKALGFGGILCTSACRVQRHVEILRIYHLTGTHPCPPLNTLSPKNVPCHWWQPGTFSVHHVPTGGRTPFMTGRIARKCAHTGGGSP